MVEQTKEDLASGRDKQMEFAINLISGKTRGFDHMWPEYIDHPKPELSVCC